MSLEQKFKESAENVNNLLKKPDNNELLEIYGLFKQATIGDINTAKPGLLEIKNIAKWDAWNLKKGISKEEAMNKYIGLVDKLKDKYGC